MSVHRGEKVPALEGGYLPWTGEGYLPWMRGGGTYIGWGYLPWVGGGEATYLGWGYLPWVGEGVPTLDGGRGYQHTYLGWGKGYLPWTGGEVPTLDRGGVPTLDRLCRRLYTSFSLLQEDSLVRLVRPKILNLRNKVTRWRAPTSYSFGTNSLNVPSQCVLPSANQNIHKTSSEFFVCFFPRKVMKALITTSE